MKLHIKATLKYLGFALKYWSVAGTTYGDLLYVMGWIPAKTPEIRTRNLC